MKTERINYIWILKNMSWVITFLLILFSVMSSFEAVLNGYIIGQIVKVNIHNYSDVTLFLLKAFLAYAITYISIYAFLNIKSIAIRSLNIKLKSIFFERGFYVNSDNSEVVNDVTGVSKQIEQNYFNPLFMMFQVIITVISSLIFIISTNLSLGLIYIAFSTLSLLPSYIGRNKLNLKTDVWSKSNSNMINNLNITINGHMDINNYGVKSIFFYLFNSKLVKEEKAYQQMSSYQYKLQLFSWIIALLSFLGPIAIGIYLSRFKFLGISNSVIVSLALTSDSVVGGIRELTTYQNVIKSTDGIRKILIKKDKPRQIDYNYNNHVDDYNSGLVVNNLSVKYDDVTVLNNISFHLLDEQKAVIIGKSGVGKSTLLEAIANNTNVFSGNVTFDGAAITNKDYAFISQNIWIFDGTLRDNISLYEQQFNDKDILEVLERSGLAEDFGDDPLNFTIENDGKNISGGQAQRISIARGLLRNRKLFLLDEITSKLDKLNSYNVRSELYKLPITILEVAHNIDEELMKKFNLECFELSENGIKELKL